MEERDLARECGIRCRQIRMAKGISQQKLADLMCVTPQAVSKWEKEGIRDINIITKLSNVLGQDITADQIDQEGAVGEIGKEILKLLVLNEGYLDYSALENELFGLDNDRIANEIFKLERIGTVVREQFKDFVGFDRDIVMITAKGMIVCKNQFPSYDLLKCMFEDISYEKRLGKKSMQEYIDEHKVSKILWNLQDAGPYRIDYITWLNNNYREVFPRVETDDYSENVYDFISGESCFADLLFRMARNISDGDLFGEMVDDLSGEDDVFDQLLWKSMSMDENTANAQKYLSGCLSGLKGFDEVLETLEDVYEDKNDKSAMEAKKEMSQVGDDIMSYYYGHSSDNFFENMEPQKRNNCSKWFTSKEVEKYLNENYFTTPNSKELCDEIDESFKQIWELDPSTLDYFYSFPEEWEKNGLAQKVRDKFGVPDRKVE